MDILLEFSINDTKFQIINKIEHYAENNNYFRIAFEQICLKLFINHSRFIYIYICIGYHCRILHHVTTYFLRLC